MIAAISKNSALHAVRWTGRVKLHVEIHTYCGLSTDAGKEGVLQVPDQAFTQSLGDAHNGVRIPACPQCRIAMNPR